MVKCAYMENFSAANPNGNLKWTTRMTTEFEYAYELPQLNLSILKNWMGLIPDVVLISVSLPTDSAVFMK